jgi:hypothetical protein
MHVDAPAPEVGEEKRLIPSRRTSFVVGFVTLTAALMSRAFGQIKISDSGAVELMGQSTVDQNLTVAGTITGFGTIPIGAVIDWYPPTQTATVPPGFVLCDGTMIYDSASLFNNKNSPNLKHAFVRGSNQTNNTNNTVNYMPAPQQSGNGPYAQTGNYTATLSTGPTQASSTDNTAPFIIQANVPDNVWRYALTANKDKFNDGKHHHTVDINIPLPAYYDLVKLLRIK